MNDRDERIIMSSPSRDLANYADFDGRNPVRADGSRPRDFDAAGYGIGTILPAVQNGVRAITIPLASGVVYATPGALVGWVVKNADYSGVTANTHVRAALRDGNSSRGAMLTVIDTVLPGFQSHAFMAFPVNFEQLYFDLGNVVDTNDTEISLYVIPTE